MSYENALTLFFVQRLSVLGAATPTPGPTSPLSFDSWKDIFQILFFGITAVLGILSYVQARKGLFFPIRTEVFKEQIKLFSTVLTFFQGKNRHELLEDIGFPQTVGMNLALLSDVYLAVFLGQKVEPQNRPYSRAKASILFMPERKDNLPLEAESVTVPFFEVEYLLPRPGEDKRNAWSRYAHKNTVLSDAFINTERRLKELAFSPLMPEKCVVLVQNYIELINKNVHSIGPELERIAQPLPDRWPDSTRIVHEELFWVQNRINDGLEDPLPKAQAIVEFIRNYCRTNELFRR